MSVIVRLAGRGDGVTADGRHIPYTAPGDEVAVDGTIVPGPHHQSPPCAHYPQCGACQLQHVDDVAYAAYVRDRITHALAAQGLNDVEVRAPYLSPPRTRRRASLKAQRKGREVRLGFNAAGSHALVDVRDCPALLPELTALLAPLRRLLVVLMRDRAQAEVQLTRVDQGVDVVITGVEADGVAAAEAIGAFAAHHKLARLSLDEGYGLSTRWEPEPATVTLGRVPVAFPAGAFLQATADGEAALLEAVCGILGNAAEVADLFAGLGTFALPLAAARNVHAVEGARDPVLALTTGAKRAGRAVTTEHRDLFRRPLTSAELARFDAVVLDPPRAGAREQVDALAASAVPVIAYVSCNPQTFARDSAVMIAGGYSLASVTPVGQFRWSTHVELVGAFMRS